MHTTTRTIHTLSREMKRESVCSRCLSLRLRRIGNDSLLLLLGYSSSMISVEELNENEMRIEEGEGDMPKEGSLRNVGSSTR